MTVNAVKSFFGVDNCGGDPRFEIIVAGVDDVVGFGTIISVVVGAGSCFTVDDVGFVNVVGFGGGGGFEMDGYCAIPPFAKHCRT